MDLIFYFTVFCFIMLFGSLDINIDFDFWARLVVGKTYFQTGTLLNHDFQSYGTTNQFIDHEWGSSVIFYLIQNYLGDIGLFIFKSIMIFLTFFLIAKIIRLEKNDAKLHFLFFFFVIQSIVYNIFSTVRCQSFSFLFFVLYLYILKKSKNNYRILWTIPVINIFWANVHGGFTLGLILVLIYAIGEALNKNKSKPYFITFVSGCLTSLINPYGIKYIYFIVNALALKRTYIIEWQSSFFSPVIHNSCFKFKVFFIITVIFFIYSILRSIIKKGFLNYCKDIDKAKYLIILFCACISLRYVRFHVFYAYSILALCYNDFYNIFAKRLPEKIDNIKEIILSVLIFISLLSHLYNYKFVNQVKENEYPLQCIEFLKINNLKGNLLTNFHFGSYASYKLYPNIQVYMDGRYEEVYDVNLVNKMRETFLTNNLDLLNEYHTDYIIIEKIYPLYDKLKALPDWFLAYESRKFALFIPYSYKNRKFILPTNDMKYYNSEKFETLINWQ